VNGKGQSDEKKENDAAKSTKVEEASHGGDEASSKPAAKEGGEGRESGEVKTGEGEEKSGQEGHLPHTGVRMKPFTLREMRDKLVKYAESTARLQKTNPKLLAHLRHVDRDFLLELMLDEWNVRTELQKKALQELFREGDVSGDGVLTFEEFMEILLKFEFPPTDHVALRLFREMVERSGSDAITADIFAEVVMEEKIVCAFISDMEWRARRRRLRERGEAAEAEYRELMNQGYNSGRVNGGGYDSRKNEGNDGSALTPPSHLGVGVLAASAGGGADNGRRPSMVVIGGVAMPQAGDVMIEGQPSHFSIREEASDSMNEGGGGSGGMLGVGMGLRGESRSRNDRRRMSFLSPADSFEMLEDIWKSSEDSILQKLHLLQRAYEKKSRHLKEVQLSGELTQEEKEVLNLPMASVHVGSGSNFRRFEVHESVAAAVSRLQQSLSERIDADEAWRDYRRLTATLDRMIQRLSEDDHYDFRPPSTSTTNVTPTRKSGQRTPTLARGGSMHLKLLVEDAN